MHKGPQAGSGDVPGWEVGAGPSWPRPRLDHPSSRPSHRAPVMGLPGALQRGRCDPLWQHVRNLGRAMMSPLCHPRYFITFFKTNHMFAV